MKEIILLIEDEIELQQNLKEILEYNGYSLLVADNGQDALLKIENQKIDLILCDIMMPKMDGMQFLKIIREHSKFENTPFIFLSAKARKEDKINALLEGANDYLVKPVSSRIMLNAIHSALKNKVKGQEYEILSAESGIELSYKSPHLKTDSPLSSLIDCLYLQKKALDSDDRNEVSKLNKEAINRAFWLQTSLIKIPLIENSKDCVPQQVSVNLAEFLKDQLHNLERSRFSLSVDHFARISFDPIHLSFICKEIIENAYKFSLPENPIIVEFVNNELIINNKQNTLNPTDKIEIRAFSNDRREQSAVQGLGIGLYLVNNYCVLNRANLECMVNFNAEFVVKIKFSY